MVVVSAKRIWRSPMPTVRSARVTDSSRSDNFVAFLGDLVALTPPGLELHCIVDNLSAYSTAAVEAFLERPEHHHVFLYRTPTHASWLNQVELFSSILERRLLRRGEFESVDDLADHIIAFITTTTAGPRRFAGPTMAAR